MHVLRSLPDTSLAAHLTAAFGRPVVVSAPPTGEHAVVALPSGACLFCRPRDGRVEILAVPAPGPHALSLDALASRRLDDEVLAAAGEIVELYFGADLRTADFELAAEAAALGEDEDDVETLAGAHAVSRGHTHRGADPAGALIDLALALYRLRELAIDNAPHAQPIDVEAVEVHPC